MPNDDEAQKAIDELNGATVQGRAIVVNKSEPKPEGERKSFSGNRGGNGGGELRWWKQSWRRLRWWKRPWRKQRWLLITFK